MYLNFYNKEFYRAYGYLFSLDGTNRSNGKKKLTITHEGSKDVDSDMSGFVRVVATDDNTEVTFFVDPRKGTNRYIYKPLKRPAIPLIELFDGRQIPTPGLEFHDFGLVIGSPLLRMGFPDEPTEEELVNQAQEHSINLAHRVRIFLDF